MSEEIKYGFPKIRKNNESVGFKTYTTCVYDMNGNTLEDRLMGLSMGYDVITEIRKHNSCFINAVVAGVDNTGTDDVWEILQRLINTYKCVYLPAGTYKVSHYIKLANGSILEGESINTTFINMVGVDKNDSASTLVCQDVSNVIIKNISIIGHNNPINQRAIRIAGVGTSKCFKNINLSNICIYDFCDKGIYIYSKPNTNGSDCSIDNVRIVQTLSDYVGTTYKIGKCIDITLNDKKDFVNINNLVCTSNEYIEGTFTNSYLGNFAIRDSNNNLLFSNNKVPIIIGINIVGIANSDKSPPIHISNSTFEGMTECIHCKQASVYIINSAFNLSIIGALLADSYSNCQIIGCTFLTLYDYKSDFGYNVKKRLLTDPDAYNLKVYDRNGDEVTLSSYIDPQPLARLELYDISKETRITKHPYILLILSIIDMRIFTNEKCINGQSNFESKRLCTVGCGVGLVYGNMTSITDS